MIYLAHKIRKHIKPDVIVKGDPDCLHLHKHYDSSNVGACQDCPYKAKEAGYCEFEDWMKDNGVIY